MNLHLVLRHKRDQRESFYDILDVSCADVSALVMDFGPNGLLKFIDNQVNQKVPNTMSQFDVIDWEFV